MTDEQTATANTQVASESKGEEDSATQTDQQAVATAAPQTDEVDTPPKSPDTKPTGVEHQSQSSLGQPRFSSGVLFFLWVFCTLVFLSITAGYIATR
ncbi:hypothetical protein [Acaryochloris sp. IP29b_bin.137]|uniref:hypothetical protein n=1 Tax=Acaryochloris sp. IP29b_bin.137 TaxID=2969217 RepID=UPI002601B7C8|nr:hypothetical protein [Acaryochloris sp. IP29b_bin.137]